MYYSRLLTSTIKKTFFSGKAVVIVGARQVGKTTLSKKIIADYEKNGKTSYLFNADNPTDRDVLNNRDLEQLKGLVADYDIILIDEGPKN